MALENSLVLRLSRMACTATSEELKGDSVVGSLGSAADSLATEAAAALRLLLNSLNSLDMFCS